MLADGHPRTSSFGLALDSLSYVEGCCVGEGGVQTVLWSFYRLKAMVLIVDLISCSVLMWSEVVGNMARCYLWKRRSLSFLIEVWLISL